MKGQTEGKVGRKKGTKKKVGEMEEKQKMRGGWKQKLKTGDGITEETETRSRRAIIATGESESESWAMWSILAVRRPQPGATRVAGHAGVAVGAVTGRFNPIGTFSKGNWSHTRTTPIRDCGW